MTSVIAVDQATIHHDAQQGGVGFHYSEGVRRRRVFVPDGAIRDFLQVAALSPTQAEGFVRSKALNLALFLANRPNGTGDDNVLLTLDDLRAIR